jgi:hypothetical protein
MVKGTPRPGCKSLRPLAAIHESKVGAIKLRAIKLGIFVTAKIAEILYPGAFIPWIAYQSIWNAAQKAG